MTFAADTVKVYLFRSRVCAYALAMALIGEQKLSTLASDVDQQKAAAFSLAKKKLKKQLTVRVLYKQLALGLVIGLVIIATSIAISVRGLEKVYPKAYGWWNGWRVRNTNPPSQGSSNVTVETVAISAMYSDVAWLMALTFMATPLSTDAAIFLLTMIEVFGNELKSDDGSIALYGLTDVHWNGSPEQLRHNEWRKFLPPITQGGVHIPSGKVESLNWAYIWSCHEAITLSGRSANPWYMRIWPTPLAFKNAPIINNYYTTGSSAGLDALYTGGLVAYALAMQSSKATAADMLHELVGMVPQSVASKCTKVQQRQAGISAGMMWGGLAMFAGPAAGIVIGPAVGAFMGMKAAKNAKCGSQYVFPTFGSFTEKGEEAMANA